MFDVDERCIGIGLKVMAATALTAIDGFAGPDASVPVVGPIRGAARAGQVIAVGPVVPVTDDIAMTGPLLGRRRPGSRRRP